MNHKDVCSLYTFQRKKAKESQTQPQKKHTFLDLEREYTTPRKQRENTRILYSDFCKKQTTNLNTETTWGLPRMAPKKLCVVSTYHSVCPQLWWHTGEEDSIDGGRGHEHVNLRQHEHPKVDVGTVEQEGNHPKGNGNQGEEPAHHEALSGAIDSNGPTQLVNDNATKGCEKHITGGACQIWRAKRSSSRERVKKKKGQSVPVPKNPVTTVVPEKPILAQKASKFNISCTRERQRSQYTTRTTQSP